MSVHFAMGEKKQKSDTAGIAKIEQLMKNREFYIEVDQAFPTGNSSITINSKYGQKRIGGEGYVSLATNEGQLFILDTVASPAILRTGLLHRIRTRRRNRIRESKDRKRIIQGDQ